MIKLSVSTERRRPSNGLNRRELSRGPDNIHQKFSVRASHFPTSPLRLRFHRPHPRAKGNVTFVTYAPRGLLSSLCAKEGREREVLALPVYTIPPLLSRSPLSIYSAIIVNAPPLTNHGSASRGLSRRACLHGFRGEGWAGGAIGNLRENSTLENLLIFRNDSKWIISQNK